MRTPTQELDHRISSLENEVKTTHPKSPELNSYLEMRKRVKMTGDKITNFIFLASISELLIGLAAVFSTFPEKNTEKALVFAGGSVAAFMGTMVIGIVVRSSAEEKMVSSELVKLDKPQ